MDLKSARAEAKSLLSELLETQPNLLTTQNINDFENRGEGLANFCSRFIETYAKYLTTHEKSGD